MRHRALLLLASSLLLLLSSALLASAAPPKTPESERSERESPSPSLTLTQLAERQKKLAGRLSGSQRLERRLDRRLTQARQSARELRANLRLTRRELEVAREAVAKGERALDRSTAEYVQLVNGLTGAPGSGDENEEMLSYLSGSNDPNRALLAYSSAQGLLNQRTQLLESLKSRAGELSRAQSRLQQRESQEREGLELEAQTLRRTERLLGEAERMSERLRNRQGRLDRSARQALEELLEEGVWAGPLPEASLLDRPVGERMVILARRELRRDVVEEPLGSNDSPDIARYRSATLGAFQGGKWCAYFTSYLAARAGAPIGPGGTGMGYVPTIIVWSQQIEAFARHPQPGDLILFPQHIGMVERVEGDRLTTIEGNSSDRVIRRDREKDSAVGFVRLSLLPNAIPPLNEKKK